jgi:A/G-specific adenine glycosylase|tara:strand:+ start:235 stop:591 length:357 start_codon:yes stop_codon:yes gene_type:complete
MVSRKGRFPCSREEIEALPGVGQYIANSIELFCYGKPLPLLDSNMSRVLERYFGPRKLADIRYDPYLQSLSKKVVKCKDPVSLNWAILDLAHIVCTQKKPQHDICPLKNRCQFINLYF